MKKGIHILGFNICANTEQHRNNISIFSIRSSTEQRGSPFPAIIYHIETISELKKDCSTANVLISSFNISTMIKQHLDNIYCSTG